MGGLGWKRGGRERVRTGRKGGTRKERGGRGGGHRVHQFQIL